MLIRKLAIIRGRNIIHPSMIILYPYAKAITKHHDLLLDELVLDRITTLVVVGGLLEITFAILSVIAYCSNILNSALGNKNI